MLDMIKAMQDPEFLKEMQEMPARILGKLERIDSLVTAIAKEHGLEISNEGVVYYSGSDEPVIESAELQQNSNSAIPSVE